VIGPVSELTSMWMRFGLAILGMALEIAPSRAPVAAGAMSRLGMGLGERNRDACVAAPQRFAMRRPGRWLGTAHIFLISYPLRQLGTGGEGNDQDPG